MGKTVARRPQAGRSATAEFRRARRAWRQRGLVSDGLALAAAVLAGLGGATRHRWFMAVSIGAAWVAWRVRPEPDPGRWQRGAAGEVATARLLATLPRRFSVVHDRRVPGGRANIDHLVVGPTGVWAIDSKSFRAGIRIRRGQVLAGNHAIDTGPVAAQAARVEERFGCPVTAIVVVHGAGLRCRGKRVDGVRVLPAGRVCRALRTAPRRLSRADVAALAGVLDRELQPAAGPHH